MVYYTRISMKSEEGVMAVTGRKKQVQRLEKITVAIVTMLLILPSIFCIILATKIKNLEYQIEELKSRPNKRVEIVWNEKEMLLAGEADNRGMVSEDVSITEEEDEDYKKVYLTFDDGPSIYTRDILDILNRYNVKATFFISGKNAQMYEGYLQEILDDGHSLGIHTYSHVYSDIYSSVESFQNDFNQTRDCIKQQTGEDVKLYRFPGGSGNGVASYHNKMKMMEWLEQEEVQYFDWNVSSGDGGSAVLSPEVLAGNCIEGVKANNMSIVLLHDAGDKRNTVEALPLIIEGINQLENVRLLPIDEDTVTIQQMSIEKDGIK